MKTIAYVTGNNQKFEAARVAFTNIGINLTQVAIETPEIQSHSVEEVAKYSAKWASQHIGCPVMVTDAGLEIEALNGFPGPFVKYVNGWFTENDYVNLMQVHENRKARIVDCLAFCIPGNEPIAFTGYYEGTIAREAADGGYTPMDRVFVPNGFDKSIAQIDAHLLTAYWSKGMILSQFVAHLTKG